MVYLFFSLFERKKSSSSSSSQNILFFFEKEVVFYLYTQKKGEGVERSTYLLKIKNCKKSLINNFNNI
jgi:hypothetical protein